jgi:hypothetical protein
MIAVTATPVSGAVMTDAVFVWAGKDVPAKGAVLKR